MVFHKKSYTFDVLFNNKDEMLDLKQLTVEVCRIATEAGHFLKEERKNFRRERVMEKHAHDYVSYVDKESEVRLVKALSALLPEAGFITEEGSATYQDEPYCWVIDPLDGTTNYIHDEAPYCVCIALRSRTELLLGVVYEVCRNECFYAWKGGKAFMNGEEIHVSDVRDIKNAFVFTELPYNRKDFFSARRELGGTAQRSKAPQQSAQGAAAHRSRRYRTDTVAQDEYPRQQQPAPAHG